ncbi:HAD-IA family hydrolase [Synechococcus sp. Nb3U1]|uniref:HAD-IA family hydrolase n=1 Tax=Synechococcus sp. Nb3U1 TaxID=1914529 RepID=UPI001F2CC616|nr:HAD-IA family hydrolase [Synechococcus sp. Nb3U1]MCF2969820.1 HAD-IA family hydrolase [Synechococcus sp. Nb3U1]
MVSVLFFDAVGTLFRVRGSVGEIYGQVAADYGVRVDPRGLDRAFYQAFARAPAGARPGLTGSDLLAWERAWWHQVVQDTFSQFGEQLGDQTGSLAGFPEFEAFFDQVFELFAGRDPWELYPETLPVLQTLREQGIQLGVISNFDSRLVPVLKQLQLEEYFSSITLSTRVGYAKADAKIFHAALKAQGIPSEQAWHIGDSYHQDYLGAKAAGLNALWLDRAEHQQDPRPAKARTPDLWGSLTVIQRN